MSSSTAWRAVPSAIIDDAEPDIGAGTRIWSGAHIRQGAHIGRDCNIGQNVYIGAGVRIGDGCKLQNNVNVYEGVTLEDHVFCGPSMTFTNLSTPLPRAAIPRHHLLESTVVRRGASLGAGAVVVCNNEIGSFAFVAAGAVVVSDVPPFALVAGCPARRIGWACVCGTRLADPAGRGVVRCEARIDYEGRAHPCGRGYRLDGRGELLEIVEDPHRGSAAVR
jgi:UDP-2-acetamido-3-amino-2,3-dideoxy-glucuronate N-acetyltransferase